ncbi:resolvase [Escherichia coli]|nr:recombinase family protein [Escherichia coli]GCU28875.1 site-specific recombinases [Escherichia coli]STH80018.1 resolvase [Escherichia coli]VWN04787.1 Transposon Tn1000 resolvase [Escherichia coli]
MALLGYARVSTSHQKLTSQVTELNTAGVRDDRVFTDMMSGATDEREGLQRLLARAEKDDIILCTKMDRLGRNTADMIRIVDTCYKKGIGHCCKVSDEAAFCLIQRPYISKTLLTRRISPRGSP